ncbi:ABC transporter permease [Martelella mediterranea]|uniref:ABC transporter permease n=1 Tax=Martelella mediterranea TaxID=293089 RepID=UPI001E5686FF|nr:ABC transporter permease [Martelella mediterranea]MCD1635808.1 ABC transporter permease [Martelella mediterranea]
MNHALTRKSTGATVVGFLRDYGAIFGMLAVLAIFYYLQPAFLHPNNVLNVLRQSAVLIAIALGMAIVMSMRGVDLSAAQIADAAGLIAAMLIIRGEPAWMAFVIPVVFGIVAGGINGILAAYIGVPAIIGTLGMMFIIRSGELVLSNGAEPQILFSLPRGLTKDFLFLGQGSIGPVATLIVLAVVLFFLVWGLMSVTSFSRRAKAIGANVRAAYLAGLSIRSVFALGFVASGALAAIGGVALASRTGVAMPRGAEPFLLDSFAAVFLGTLFSRQGGISIPGTLIGALFIGFLGNGLTIVGLGAPYRFALNGGFILLAMAVGGLKRRT